jgi:hypothetical protein
MTARTNGPPAPRPTTPRPTLAAVTTATKKLPSRILLHGVQKWGKTSWAAQAPAPVFLCTRGEDGLDTLIDAGELPPTAHFPGTLDRWADILGAVRELEGQHSHRTAVLDTVNGAARLAEEQVTEARYDGDFEKFDAFGKGGQRVLPLIIELTQALDRLRARGMSIILLAHSVVKNVKNPQGLDYPFWGPPLLPAVQEHLDRWCDAILFGEFEVTVQSKDAKATKGKAAEHQARVIKTECRATYSAGNRLGLPEEIECGASAAEAWANFMTALKTKGR